MALAGKYDKGPEKENKKSSKTEESLEIRADNWIEKTHIRNLASKTSSDTAFTLFDVYKKAHGIVSYT